MPICAAFAPRKGVDTETRLVRKREPPAGEFGSRFLTLFMKACGNRIAAQKSGSNSERRNRGAQPRKQHLRQASAAFEPCGACFDEGRFGSRRKARGCGPHPLPNHSRRQRRRHKGFRAFPRSCGFGVVKQQSFKNRGHVSKNASRSAHFRGVVDPKEVSNV